MRAPMPAPAKALMLALCTRMSRGGGIDRRYSPSLGQLARMTGYHVSTVCRYLAQLEAEGWITRDRPPPAEAGRTHQTTSYSLWIPAAYAHPSRTARRAPVAQHDTPSRPSRGAPVAQPEASPSQGESQSSQRTDKDRPSSPDDDLAAVAQTELATLTGRPVSRAAAAEAARLVLDGRADIKRPAAYLRRALRADPQRFAPAPSGPVPYRELARLQAELIANTRGNE